MTAFYAVLDPAARTLTYATGGHNPPRLASESGVHSLNGVGALPLSVMRDESFEAATVKMSPGGLLLLYADSITKAMPARENGKSHDLFRQDRLDQDRLDEVLRKSRGSQASQCIEQICSAVAEYWGDAPPMDDQSLLALRRL